VPRPEIHLRQTWKKRFRLFAGGARIHVDFHADRHFDDLGCFPGHLALLFEPDDLRPDYKVSRIEKFASGIFVA
jgi:hypothetical protein